MPQLKWQEDGYAVNEKRDLPQIRRVLVATMVLNFLSTGVKLAAGLATGALSVVADGMDSLFDGLSNIIGLAGLAVAGRPPDPSHPYGYRKFETVATLSIAFLLFLTTFELLQEAWQRLQSHAVPQINWWTAAAMVFSIIVQAGTSFYELHAGRRLHSEFLVADALHTRASILISLSVLGGLVVVRLGYPQADPILAAFVALVIGKIGLDVLREIFPVLVDQAAVDPQQIADVIENIDGIESFHRVRSRGAAGNAAVDLHVRVAPEKSIQEANAVADEVRRRLLAMDGVTDVIVHVEAQRNPPPDAPDLFAAIKLAAGELGLTMHEVWAHRLGQDLYVEMHVGVDPRLSLGEAHALVDRLEITIRQRLPEVIGIHSHIELATTRVQMSSPAPQELENRLNQEVQSAVAAIPSLSNPHNIRAYRDPATGDRLIISLECSVSPDMPVAQAHQLASQLEEGIIQRLPQASEVSVHLEPPE
jgi:cation diffusion facilitator family transporter